MKKNKKVYFFDLESLYIFWIYKGNDFNFLGKQILYFNRETP